MYVVRFDGSVIFPMRFLPQYFRIVIAVMLFEPLRCLYPFFEAGALGLNLQDFVEPFHRIRLLSGK